MGDGAEVESPIKDDGKKPGRGKRKCRCGVEKKKNYVKSENLAVAEQYER